MVYLAVDSGSIKSVKRIKHTFAIRFESYITYEDPSVFSSLVNSYVLVLSGIHHTLMQEKSPMKIWSFRVLMNL